MRPMPRVSTRGYYDLKTGRALKKNRYYLYPRKSFDALCGSREIAIMVHGLRNDRTGAVQKALIAKKRLRKLGYVYPVIGFSYDSNTTGAHLAKSERRALAVGQRIAVKNGRHLGLFIEDFKVGSPNTRVRLLGHSLGSQVIHSALTYLAGRGHTGVVEGVHLFGASIPDDSVSPARGAAMQSVVRGRITNLYAPTDEILGDADGRGLVKGPLGLRGARGSTIPGYVQKRVKPRNHRFASYAAVLGSYP